MNTYTINNVQYSVTEDTAPLAAPHVQVTGMNLVGLSKSIATNAVNSGHFYGVDVTGTSPAGGITLVKNAINNGDILVYTP